MIISRLSERGQVIPLTAAMMIVLLGMSALAIDVGRKYSDERFLRSAVDAASLAGAQDLQVGGRNAVPTAANYQTARTRARDLLVRQVRGTGTGTGSGCDTSANMENCPITGTPYRFSITTPYNGCVSCKAAQAVKVTLTNPTFDTTFARVMGQTTWTTSQTSVAGSVFGSSYAVVMLRPPDIQSNGNDKNKADFEINGGAQLEVTGGDIGSNTSVVAPSNSKVDVELGYYVYHRDVGGEQDFNSAAGNHPPKLMRAPYVVDPQYPVPADPTPTFRKQSEGRLIACTGLTPPAPSDATACYQPGTYSQTGDSNRPFDIKSAEVVYLTPGIYSFPTGININGTVKGGVTAGAGAVTIVLPCCGNNNFAGASAEGIFLNTGAVLPTRDQNNVAIATPGGTPLTLIVRRNDSCFSGVTPKLCSGNQNNQVLQLSGGGKMFIGGVQYAPSDNIQIGGTNSVGTGTIGHIVSWTLKVNNGVVRQEGRGDDGPGILRLDEACSPTNACP